jgi:O-antigen ligase
MLSAKLLQRILQIGVLLSFLTIFFVFKPLLFPYITAKQLPLNLIVELLLPIWLVLLIYFPKFRPKKRLIAYGILAYLLAILISCFNSVDFQLSFWGNAERMLGWFHLSHYFLLYFYLITAFRNKRDWRLILSFSVILALIQSFVILIGDNKSGTIGNTAYVSGYLIFNIYFSLILFLRYFENKWRYFFLFAIIPMLIAFAIAKTSGAIFGLGFSVLVLLFLLGFFSVKKKFKKITLSLAVLFLLFIIIFFSQANKDWFQANPFLKGLTFNKPTFQTRLVSWEAALKEFPNQPILGVGYGNYAYVFDKHFDSRFLTYSRSETYFDRAHNNIIDITSTTGLVGLITYLSIFVFVLYYLIKLFKEEGGVVKEGKEGNLAREILIIIALLIAYFVQNLAVFDTQTTYLSLMILFAYITYLAERQEIEGEFSGIIKLQSRKLGIVVLILSSLLSLYLISNINYRVYLNLRNSLSAYVEIIRNKGYSAFINHQKSLETPSTLDRDARSVLVNLYAGNPNLVANFSKQEQILAIEYIISLAKKNLEYNPIDTLKNLQLAKVYEAAARHFNEDEDKFNDYYNQAISTVNQAIASSPSRAPLYLSKAQIYLVKGEIDLAKEQINYAISLNTNYPDGYCQLSQVEYALENEEKALNLLEQCLSKGGANLLRLENLIILAIEHYQEKEEYQSVVYLLERLAQLRPEDANVFVALSRFNLEIGLIDKAIAAAQAAVSIDPSLEQYMLEFIENINK